VKVQEGVGLPEPNEQGVPLQYHEVAPVEVLVKLTIRGAHPELGDTVKLAVCAWEMATPPSSKHRQEKARNSWGIGAA
jgi:hypothetical protein